MNSQLPKSCWDLGKNPAKNRGAARNFRLPKSQLDLGVILAKDRGAARNSLRPTFRWDLAMVPVRNRCGLQNSWPRSQREAQQDCHRMLTGSEFTWRGSLENHTEILLTDIIDGSASKRLGCITSITVEIFLSHHHSHYLFFSRVQSSFS